MDETEARMNCLHFSEAMIKTEPPDDYPDPVFSTSSGDADVYTSYTNSCYSADVNLEYNFEQYQYQYQNIKQEPAGDFDYSYSDTVMHPHSEQFPEMSQNLIQIKVEPVEEEEDASCSSTANQCPFPSTLFAVEDQGCGEEEESDAQHDMFLPDNSTVIVNTVGEGNSGEMRSSNEAAFLTDHSSTESSDMMTPIIVDVQGNFSFHDLQSHASSLEEEGQTPLPESNGESYLHLKAYAEMTSPSLALSGHLPVLVTEDAKLNSSHAGYSDGQDVQVCVPGGVEDGLVVLAVEESTQVRNRRRKISNYSECGGGADGPSNSKQKTATKILKVNHDGVEKYICYPAVSEKVVMRKNAQGKLVYHSKCIHCEELVERGQLLLHYLEDHGISASSWNVHPYPDMKMLPAKKKRKASPAKNHQGLALEEEKPGNSSSVCLKMERANFKQRLKDSCKRHQMKVERVKKHLADVKEECLAITIGNKMRYRCVICPEEYSAVGIFYHAKAHAKDMPAVCKGCKSDILSVQNLRQHIQSCQEELEEVISSCKCVVCLVDCKEGIFFHAAVHEKELPKHCAGCCQPMYSVFDVRQHSRNCQSHVEVSVLVPNTKQKSQKEPRGRCVPRILRRGLSQKTPQKESTLSDPKRSQPPVKGKSRNGQNHDPDWTAGKTMVSHGSDVSQTVSAAPQRTLRVNPHRQRNQKSSRSVRKVPQIVVDVVHEEDTICPTEPFKSVTVERVPQQSEVHSSAVSSRTRAVSRAHGGAGSPSKSKPVLTAPKPREGPRQCVDSDPMTRRKSSRLCAKMAAAAPGNKVTVSSSVSRAPMLTHAGSASPGTEGIEETHAPTDSCRLRPRKTKVSAKV